MRTTVGRSTASTRGRGWTARAALVIALACAAAAAGSGAGRPLTGRPLAAALAELQAQGHKVLYSSALVRPEMRVESEPAGVTPGERLASLLAPHGLAVVEGPDGALLVVPGRLPAPVMESAIRGVVRERRGPATVAGATVGGAEVRLPAAGRRAVSADDGRFELAVGEGRYRLEAHKEGFVSARLENVRVLPGRVTEVAVDLLPLPTTLDEIDVMPRLEVGSLHEGTTLRRAELERIPTPRDPWALVTQAPGILADRINVGGSESGVQAEFLAPASSNEDNVFSIDGVNTTDMAATGASALYYDFDQFEELRVSTGGSDVRTTTAGVTVHMVTKRGTDALRGSARLLATDGGGFLGLFEQRPPDVSDELAPGQAGVSGNRVDRILDYGLEAGGPLRRDRLWAWGSAGRTDVDMLTLGELPDDTWLDHSAFKLNAQPRPSSSLVASVHRGHKKKENRGAGPDRSTETTWRQRGPAYVSKLEDTHVLTSRFFLSGGFNFVDGGFGLIPRSGAGKAGGEALQDADGVWKNGYWGGFSDRDSETAQAEGSYFFDVGDAAHALDFGGSLRRFRYADDFGWAGPRQAYSIACENVGLCEDGIDLVGFERRGRYRAVLDYAALWIQDALTAGRWTWTAGLRFDLQDGRNLPGTVAANPALPGRLPGVDYAGSDGAFQWRTLSPRLAAACAVDGAGRTTLRLSLGRFAEQLGVFDVARLNPLGSVELLYGFTDADGDNVWQEGEPLEFLGSFGLDPDSPLESAHRTDPGFEPELTDELLVGLERALTPEWVVGVNVTLRRISNVPELRPLVDDGVTVRAALASDYVPVTQAAVVLPDGRSAAVTFYALHPSLVATGGQYLASGDREREYAGLTLSFQRRLSERWTMRGHLNLGDATWRVPASFRLRNDPTDLAGEGDNDGDLFAAQGSGAHDDVFMQSSWTAQWSGFYRVAPERPWGFTVAANVVAREGYPIPYLARQVSSFDGIARFGQVTRRLDDFRTDDVLVADLSLQKDVDLRGRLSATLSLTAFNVFNESYVLRRERNLTSARPDYLEETLAPRIVRFGVRLRW